MGSFSFSVYGLKTLSIYILRSGSSSHLSKKLTTKSLPDIGRKFTGRDHTTVIHAIKKVEELMAADKKFEYEVQDISNKILKSN